MLLTNQDVDNYVEPSVDLAVSLKMLFAIKQFSESVFSKAVARNSCQQSRLFLKYVDRWCFRIISCNIHEIKDFFLSFCYNFGEIWFHSAISNVTCCNNFGTPLMKLQNYLKSILRGRKRLWYRQIDENNLLQKTLEKAQERFSFANNSWI